MSSPETSSVERAMLDAARLAADAIVEATSRRDAVIRAARDHGLPLRLIADAAGLSHTTVANIAPRGPAQPQLWVRAIDD